MGEDALLDMVMEDRMSGGGDWIDDPEPFWMDDFEVYNQNEADDCREEYGYDDGADFDGDVY